MAAMRPSCEINLFHQIKPCPSAERLLVIWPEHESCAYSIFQCGNSPSKCLPAGSCPHASGHSLHLACQCNLNTCFLQILLVLQIWFISHLFRRHVTEVHKHVLLLWFQGWSTIYRLLSDGLFQGSVLKLVKQKCPKQSRNRMNMDVKGLTGNIPFLTTQENLDTMKHCNRNLQN